jgi:hypothetical protein
MLAQSLELSLLSPYRIGMPPLDGVMAGVVVSLVLFLAVAAVVVRLAVEGWLEGI